jgi:hypothetical protein
VGSPTASTIRAHHLLCRLGFRGLGYSDAFAANMAAVLRTLDGAPEARVAVTDAPDAICAAFPAGQPRHCEGPEVIARDRHVLARIGVAAGHALPWAQLRRRVAGAFAPDDLPRLCATCGWLPLGYCADGVARARAQIGNAPGSGE